MLVAILSATTSAGIPFDLIVSVGPPQVGWCLLDGSAEHGDRHGAGVDPAAPLGWRNALNAMAAGFVFKA